MHNFGRVSCNRSRRGYNFDGTIFDWTTDRSMPSWRILAFSKNPGTSRELIVPWLHFYKHYFHKKKSVVGGGVGISLNNIRKTLYVFFIIIIVTASQMFYLLATAIFFWTGWSPALLTCYILTWNNIIHTIVILL